MMLPPFNRNVIKNAVMVTPSAKNSNTNYQDSLISVGAAITIYSIQMRYHLVTMKRMLPNNPVTMLLWVSSFLCFSFYA